ncbi:MAG: aspartate aminotransferase family protein [Promethearchaeota archaeon]
MDKNLIVTIEDDHDYRQFNKKIPIVKGEGAVLFDADGNKYIDCVGGHGVSILGHSHPKLIKALIEHLKDSRPLTCGHFYDENRAKLFQTLAERTPQKLNRIFLSNSGTEAVEAALKFAMKYKKSIKNKEIIAMKRGFHGRTLGALSCTFNPRYRRDYVLIPGVHHASFNNIDSVSELINDNTVAIITELIQGEGGVYPADNEFPKQLRELCDDKQIALIFDEVQTGFGRTGKLFAFEHWNVTPDILCLAKGIAGGIPMGATITTNEIMESVEPGAHGNTFGGNPLASRAALETIKIIDDERLVNNSAEVGEYLFNKLKDIATGYRIIKEIRGIGLMIGIQFKIKVSEIISKLMEKGVLALTAGITVLRLLPPLVITKDQAKQVLEAIESVLAWKSG